MRIGTGICLSWNTAPNDIAYSKYFRPLGFGQFNGSKGIGSFTALAYSYYNIVFLYYWVSVSELLVIFHLNRNPCELLKEIFPQKSRMI